MTEYEELLEKFTIMEVEINGFKKRSGRGKQNIATDLILICISHTVYAIKDVGVFYLMRTYPDVYRKLGLSWDDGDNSYCHVCITF